MKKKIERQGQRSEMLLRKLVDLLKDKKHSVTSDQKLLFTTRGNPYWGYRIYENGTMYFKLAEAVDRLEEMALKYPEEILKVKDSRGFDMYAEVGK